MDFSDLTHKITMQNYITMATSLLWEYKSFFLLI